MKSSVEKVISSLPPWTKGIWENKCKNTKLKTVHNIAERRNLNIEEVDILQYINTSSVCLFGCLLEETGGGGTGAR